MASQGSQSTLNPRVCLALLKFSYATVAEGSSAPIPWKHISTNGDLFVILDTIETQGPAGAIEKRQHFQVLQGNEVLEDIDLNILASEAQRAAEQTQAIPGLRPFPLITIIVKLPCVAMRYPLAGGRVRRFQVRFNDDGDYYEMMKCLSKAGVPTIEAGPSAGQSAPSANPQNKPVGFPSHPTHDFIPTNRPSTATAYEYKTNSQSSNSMGVHVTSSLRPSTSGAISMHKESIPFSTQPRINDIASWNRPEFLGTVSGSTQVGTGNMIDKSPKAVINIADDNPSQTTFVSSSMPGTHKESSSMPPRRELPFSRRTKKQDASENQAAHATQPISTNGQVEQQASKATKRNAPKAKKEPAPKKSRTTSSRKKADSGESNPPGSVPSVEELLRQKMAEDGNAATYNQALDTQILVNRAEERLQRSRVVKQINTPESTPGARREGFDDRPANVRETDVQATPDVQATRHSMSRNKGAASNDPVTQVESRQSIPSTPDMPTSTTLTKHHIISEHQNIIDNPTLSPAFTQTIDGNTDHEQGSNKQEDTSWAAKRSAIETWICQQIDDDEFMDVCKIVESVWARAFIKP